MILTDAGPLIAILDRKDRDHGLCAEALAQLQGPLVTTWPAFTEAMYLLNERAGWNAQENCGAWFVATISSCILSMTLISGGPATS